MIMEKYKNKKFSILGDSLSTFEGVSVPYGASFYDTERKVLSGVTTPSKTWWGRVIAELGGELLVNNSISGSTVIFDSSYQYPSYGCSDERTSSLHTEDAFPDVIIVYLGTNDWGHGVKPSLGEDNKTENLSVFDLAYAKMLEKLKANYPDAEIWCCTLSVSRCSKSACFEFPYFSGGEHIAEYCKIIRKCADKFNCRLIDLYINPEAYDTIDHFHANSDGMQTIADGFLNSLKNNTK